MTIMIKNSLLALFVLAFATPHSQLLANADAGLDEAIVRSILGDMEDEVKKFRDEIERAFMLRCDSDTLSDCGSNNYNDCSSAFPNPTCSKISTSDCGCGLNIDTTISKVTVPRALLPSDLDPDQLQTASPVDHEVIQTACYTRLVEPYMVDSYRRSEEYWKEYGGKPGSIYFGAHNGLFRMVPAKHQPTCWDFDHRFRPWCVAASSGPKDVVLVLDISASMAPSAEQSLRLKKAKEAATTVIDTLTVSDKVAIVVFNGNASVLTLASNDNKEQLIVASNENKEQLKEKINLLEADGATNFYDAFDVTFRVLSDSFRDEAYAAKGSGCNVAVIFLTDGAIAEYKQGEELEAETERVITLVKNRTAGIETDYSRKTTVFGYSLGDESDTDVMKQIACQTNGIWTHITDDEADNLISEMGAYYQLFAAGLGASENNKDFVAWVEPYTFKSDGKLGTTVSVPVFDRSVTPYVRVGVAGIDVYMEPLQAIMKDRNVTEWMKNDFIVKPAEECPTIEPTQCQLDALRSSRGGINATCGFCSNYEGLSHTPCSTQTESVYSNGLWKYDDLAGNDDNTCCECNGASELEEPDDDRPREPNPNRTIVIAVAVTVAVVVVVATAALVYRNRTGDVVPPVDATETPTIKELGDVVPPVDATETPTIEELRAQFDAIKAGSPPKPKVNVNVNLKLKFRPRERNNICSVSACGVPK